MLYKSVISFTATTHKAGSTSFQRSKRLHGYLMAIRYRGVTSGGSTILHYSTAQVIQITRDHSTAAFKSSDSFLIQKFLPSSTEQWFYPTRQEQGTTGGFLPFSTGETVHDHWPFINEKVLICLQPTSSGAGTTGHTRGTLEFYMDGTPSMIGAT